jgi:hypothetical protein
MPADTRARVAAALTVGAAFLFTFLPGAAQAANGPKWSPSELAAFADVVITARVVSAAPGWDSQVNAIYTYVTVDVTDVLKGDIREGRITIKQLGGSAGVVGLSISDQATFSVGETVLLYLEARPAPSTRQRSGRASGPCVRTRADSRSPSKRRHTATAGPMSVSCSARPGSRPPRSAIDAWRFRRARPRRRRKRRLTPP